MRATTIPAIGRSALLHHLWNRRKHTPTPAACRHTMCASEQTAFGGSDIVVTDRPLCISLCCKHEARVCVPAK